MPWAVSKYQNRALEQKALMEETLNLQSDGHDRRHDSIHQRKRFEVFNSMCKATRSKKLLGTTGIATRSKKLVTSSSRNYC